MLRVILLFLAGTLCCVAQTTPNYWTNSTGKFEDTNSWSLHILPDASQEAVIGKDGTATVVIDSSTTRGSGTALTVGAIELLPAYSLVLSNTDANIPFVVLTNLYMPAGGVLDQYAGTSVLTQLDVNGGLCRLHDGNMSIGTLNLAYQAPEGGATFVQSGGTNQVGGLTLSTEGAEYELDGGSLFSEDVSLYAALQFDTTFQQSGGIHIVTNTLSIEGSAGHDAGSAYYILANGCLYAHFLKLGEGDSFFFQQGGTTLVSTAIQDMGPGYAPGTIKLDAGVLGCMTFLNTGGEIHIRQSGGTFIVTNLLQFGGYCPGDRGVDYNIPAGFAEYRFAAGTLSASNIDLGGILDISNSVQSLRITNEGYFKLAGTINVGDSDEQLGRLILATETATNYSSQTAIVISNSVINFTGNSTTLAFANSSSEIWSDGVILFVTNWNGSITGGGNEVLRFGANASSLTASQLSQIRFVNPAGFPTGSYAARILSTGEVVPYAPSISVSNVRNGLVIAWPDDSYALQFATNILGPWTNVPGATSPYTNAFSFPQEFFRLNK